jgi:two-component system chemotaxis response regulator CheB
MEAHERIRVLVVDDSAVVRESMRSLLVHNGRMQVEVAADPVIALSKLKTWRPDVILLDLEMPRMDGLSFLRTQMSTDPLPVVVCSGLAGDGTEAGLRALAEGAVAVVAKPKLGIREFLHESAQMLIETVREAAGTRMAYSNTRRPREAAAPFVTPGRVTSTLRVTSHKVVAIGASTGGTEALRQILSAMPPDAPGAVIVQHMPEFFTAAFAKRLNELCAIEVKEAATGDRILEGRALIAPGNRHLKVQRDGAQYVVRVEGGPPVSRHRPSVDVLFRSVAESAGPNAVGLIMTGMGSDGAQGLLEMKQAGAITLAQDEASCVVFGMPKEAIALGAVDEVLSLDALARAVLRSAGHSRF